MDNTSNAQPDAITHAAEVARLNARVEELERQYAERGAALFEAHGLTETLRSERDSARRDVEELLAGDPRTPRGDIGDDGLSSTVAALCDVYRITQAGGADRQRFFDAAVRGGELLAERLLPKG